MQRSCEAPLFFVMAPEKHTSYLKKHWVQRHQHMKEEAQQALRQKSNDPTIATLF
jgi:hypothetical protein